MPAAEVSAADQRASKSSDIDCALSLLKKALAILDKSDIAPEIRARLAEVAAATEQQQDHR